MGDTHLVAVCGLYCGACSIYRATRDENEQKLEDFARGLTARTGKTFSIDDVRCDGCLGKGQLDLWCRNCRIRVCEKLQSGRVRCSDCDEFPCTRLTDFRDDGMKHHIEITENLECIQKMGIETWAEHEEKRWSCPKCKAVLSWYDSSCPGCNTPRSKGLFSL
jgi:hypothetical protein